MSDFRRTINGLNNQHLFHDVDIIVFVEGGDKSYTKAEVYSGMFHNETEDIIFWRNIFTIFNSGKKVKFKSVGSKATIKEILLDIVDGRLQTVMVAMDNEFDEILKKRIIHPNVFYTYGYSWENDAWNEIVIKSIIEELTAVRIENDDVKTNFNSFLKSLKIAVYADGYLFKRSSSFFPRKTGHLFCVECNSMDLPKIKTIEINNRLVAKGLNKKRLYSFGSKYSIDTRKFCFGHLLADYCCQLILNYLKNRHALMNLRKEIIYRMSINKFFQLCFNDGYIYDYYKLQFERNVI
jgi:hypothetical protein